MHDPSTRNRVITYKSAIDLGRESLKDCVENPQSEALMLLQHASQKNKEYLIAHNEDSLDPQAFADYQHYLTRRKSGEPIAYIKQEKEFWSLPISVNEHVLIPRPETELLVETALSLLSEKPDAKILDLGTGSGCIALAIAKELPNATIVASDASESCVQTALQNAKNLQLHHIEFITSHWFDEINVHDFDLIVSNPPYISSDDPNIEPNVRHYEPSSALFADNNGLSCLFHIIENAGHYLSNHGYILLEHGHQQAHEIRNFLATNDFAQLFSYKDMQQYERATSGMFSQ